MSRNLLSTAIDILEWLEADLPTPAQTQVARDSRIGRELKLNDRIPPHKQVLDWWSEIEATTEPGQLQQSGHHVASLVSIATGLLLLLGFMLGIGVAGVIFGYKGDYPVNLFALLGISVGLPLLMLIASALLFKGRALVPKSIRDALNVLSPGRWIGAWLEKQKPVGLFESVTWRPGRGDFARWQLLAFSQSFAIGYFIGILVLACLLIVFTDLAFGWSTTLNVDAATAWRLLHALSLPWESWLPMAAPDRELVEASRFYRLDTYISEGNRAAELGRWWPFVLMTILSYGLLPRILVAILANWQVHRATRRMLEEGPEITALLDRLHAPVIDFESPVEDEPAGSTSEIPPAMAQVEISGDTAVIIWNDALKASQMSTWLAARSADTSPPVCAAEWQSLADQREVLAGISPPLRQLIILTKGWEPPLLAFNDYLDLVRETLGSDPVIVIVPLDTSLRNIQPEDRVVWASTLARRKDPKLYVASAT